jgi:hypothetical protein
MYAGATLGPMNPIALVEATAAARSAVLGALATDLVVPGRRAGTAAASNGKWRTGRSNPPAAKGWSSAALGGR